MREVRLLCFGARPAVRAGCRWVNPLMVPEERRLPTPRVTDARRRIPGDRGDLVVAFLDPDGAVVAQMHDRAEGFAVVEAILNARQASEAGEPGLNPGVAAHCFGPRQREVLHHAESFGVRPEISMEESVCTGIFVGVGEGELVADGVLLEKAEGMADADVEVCAGDQTGTVEVGTRHHEEVGRSGLVFLRACRAGA